MPSTFKSCSLAYLLLKIKSELFGNVIVISFLSAACATLSSIVISAISPYPSTEIFLASPAVAANNLSVTTSVPDKEYLPDVANESSPSKVIAGLPFLGVPTIATATSPSFAVTVTFN